jgi:MarR family transcriptional repressor of emrRAB
MNEFGPTDERLRRVQTRMPGFPLDAMRLLRMTYHLQKSFRDITNAALKKYELVDSSYTVLAILYGSPDETASASALSEACQEKAANLTRVSDELVARGLIERGPKPGDRRAVMISLSERGRALIEQVLPEITAMVNAAYDGFTPEELGQLAALQARVIGNLARLAP